MTHTVGDQIVETLDVAGVDQINGIVGDSLNGLTDALRRHGGVELSALIEALAQRAVDTPETKLHVGSLEIDLIKRTAKRGSRFIYLLPREFRLLEYMMRHKGRVLTRETLLREVWKRKFVSSNLVDVHMGRLRRKVDGPHEPPIIHTVHRKGFILHGEDGQSALEQRKAAHAAPAPHASRGEQVSSFVLAAQALAADPGLAGPGRWLNWAGTIPAPVHKCARDFVTAEFA
jgi:DNA-binding winged helix-turn-helix (wHTH) protein